MQNLKSSNFWDTMPPSMAKVNQHLEGTYCLHLQCQGVSKARNHHEAGNRVFLAAYDLFSRMTDDFQLHSIISQKIVPF